MRVLLAAHDAGGAEILSAWYRDHVSEYELYCCLAGPALNIFKRDHNDLRFVESDFLCSFDKGDWVLTATSLENSLERSLIKKSKELNIHCVSFLDHWDLYEPRFEIDSSGEFILPNELWVGDEYAFKYAQNIGFKTEILLKENPYFSYIKKIGRQFNGTIEYDILYIGEPVSVKFKETFGSHAEEYDDELIIMKKFLKTLKECGFSGKLKVRLHPREAKDKYNFLFHDYADFLDITISGDDESLLENIQQSGVVVGIESMGLIIAHFLDKKVFSYCTGKEWDISLPYPEIICIDSVSSILN